MKNGAASSGTALECLYCRLEPWARHLDFAATQREDAGEMLRRSSHRWKICRDASGFIDLPLRPSPVAGHEGQ